MRTVNFSKYNKYNAKKSSYRGRSYHSGLERAYAEKLDWLKKAGEIESWTPQFKLSLDLNGVHIANYFMDFAVYYKDGRIEMHEVKGYETDLWRMKWRLAKAIYQDYNFVLIK